MELINLVRVGHKVFAQVAIVGQIADVPGFDAAFARGRIRGGLECQRHLRNKRSQP